MEFRIGINIFEGMITGVDDFGRLHMIDREQKPHTYLHKEIEYIIPWLLIVSLPKGKADINREEETLFGIVRHDRNGNRGDIKGRTDF